MGPKILLTGLITVSVCCVSMRSASASTPMPKITSVSPASATVGTAVTIRGTNLAGATNVTFNGTSARGSITIDRPTRILVYVPRGATTGYIKVKTPVGTAKSVSKFTVLAGSGVTTTKAIPSIGLGYSNSDSAVVLGNATFGSPTGTVTFYECGPTASPLPCNSRANQLGGPVSLTLGAEDTSTALSISFTPNSTGWWCFAGYYSGDSNYETSSDTGTDECFNVYTPLGDAMSVASDDDGYCTLLTSGGVDCWGYGGEGELGNGTFYTSSPYGSAVPVAVEGVGGTGTLTGVTSLIDDSGNYCALLISGAVDCWGYGAEGELGNGTFPGSPYYGSDTPVEVEGVGGTGTLTGVSSLAGGAGNICALLTSGGVDCWGSDYVGVLGNGPFNGGPPSDSATPVEVG